MYVDKVLGQLKKMLCSEDYKNNEFYQAVEEVFESLRPVLTDEHIKNKTLERFIIPEQVHKFKILWEDDSGTVQVDTGYRVQYSSILGTYKGGLRMDSSVNENILSFLAFEQTFKNSLTGLPMGGAKGGSTFSPKGKSDSEIRRFCYAFATKINPYIGDKTDVPAGDIGTGSRELGYIYGKLKELRNRNEMGIISGKPITMGGSLARKEATGYGIVYFLINMLEGYNLLNSNHFPERNENYVVNLIKNQPLQGRNIVISGSGNVAIYAAEKVIMLGGKVLAMSDSSGTLIDLNGINLNRIKDIKEVSKGSLIDYTKDNLDSSYIKKEDYKKGQHKIWDIEGTDIALPCATQNELNLNDARNLLKNGCLAVVEGANMPSTKSAVKFLLDNKSEILFSPSKASNAGGVATSFLEMSQNASLERWHFSKVEGKISEIMYSIFKNSFETAKKYGDERNLVMGANIYSFERLVKEMNNQGIIS